MNKASAVIIASALFLAGCIDVPKPQVDITVELPLDILANCTNSGYTAEQCAYYMCAAFYPAMMGGANEPTTVEGDNVPLDGEGVVGSEGSR